MKHDDPIDEIEWMTESERHLSKRRRRLHQERLQRQRLAVVTCFGIGISMGVIAWVLLT